MGHKLQVSRLSDTTRAVIEYENGAIVATTVGDIDHEKFANEIVTAVNVMPEMIKFLTEIVDQDSDYDTTDKAEKLLLKLEAVDAP